MAVHASIAGAPLDVALASLPLLQTIGAMSRQEVEQFVELAIDLLDLTDGDLDIEANGDELDSNGAEDDFGKGLSFGFYEPGCPISDPGGDSLDYGELDEAEGAVVADHGVDQRKAPSWVKIVAR